MFCISLRRILLGVAIKTKIMIIFYTNIFLDLTTFILSAQKNLKLNY